MVTNGWYNNFNSIHDNLTKLLATDFRFQNTCLEV